MSKFDIAAEMNSIISSPVHQSIFGRPDFVKTAAKKDDDKAAKEKAAKEKAKAKEKEEKEKAKVKAEKEKEKAKAEKAKAKKKAMTKYEVCVKSLCAASEILDEAGLSKASTLTLMALDSLITTAAKKKDEKAGKKEDKKEDKKDKKFPPKKDEKKPAKKDDKKVKKASDGECVDCGDQNMAADDKNLDFEQLMAELGADDEGDWDVLNKETNPIDVEDPELMSLVENLEDEEEPQEEGKLDTDPLAMIASKKKTSLQKLAEELGKSFLE
jgi:hypothetical protein